MEIKIPLTIEKQLENYSKMPGHSDRHETLWHAWHQNKQWLGQLLQITLGSFPTYSRHDESHALSVINNIEMILGQERIAQLSATDCFVLLHTVYIHDIGMCITQQDRKEIIENEAFMEMVDRLEQDGDAAIRKSIKALKNTNYETDKSSNEERVERLKHLYRAKLDVYYAVVELIANYRRTEHGDKSAERLYEWTLKPDKLGTGFSMAGVPLRIFLAIARSAQMHTCNKFDEIKKLPRRDGGYASDYYHPRFISVLLMLGDVLDMDNDRFHPMVLEFVEEFPETSKAHYDKHRSIRRLNISPDVIEIEADCDNQNALRLVRRECDMLSQILHDAGYMWTSICPEEVNGSLPFLSEPNLYLKGKKIPEELVTAQFNISQKKAFSILEGSNLYEGRFVFLREFLQNAIDASKMQYFYDYLGTAAYYYGDDTAKEKSPDKMNAELPLDKYPIEICMKMQKRDELGKTSDVIDEDIKKIQEGKLGKYEYGVLVSIKDFGTGIDKESITAISMVGNSRLRDKKIIQRMPEWLRPTAEFGVGLQSAFLLTGSFKCHTYTRSGECYEITFNSGASTQNEGYINVVPIEHFGEKRETYGTCFKIFVPLEKKYLHSESICTWSGTDPFNEDYDCTRIFRHSAELISQMVLYLDRILGEMLFPIKLRVDDKDILNLALNQNGDNTIHKIEYQIGSEVECEKKKLWIFRESDDKFFWGNTSNATFALEYNTARLHIWAKEIKAFCVVSGANLLEREKEQVNGKTQSAKGVTIFYKGIKLECKCVEEIEIFEFIDIKGNLARSYINISRRGFTTEGEKYFEKEVYKKLLSLVREILQFINKNSESLTRLKENIIGKIENNLLSNDEKKECKKLNDIEYRERVEKLAKQLVSLAFLSHLAVKDVNDELSHLGKNCGIYEECVWQKTINEVNERLEKNSKLKDELERYSILFEIQGYDYHNTYVENKFTILDLFSNKNHFGIFQKRKDSFDVWKIYIISIEQHVYDIYEQKMLSGLVKSDDNEKKDAKSLDEQIEMWTDSVFELSDDIGNEASSVLDKQKYQQQFLLVWLLQNIPTIGMFCDKDGNKRLNVLGDYIYPYIYTNQYHRRQIVERILKTAAERKFNRFSTYAWQGRQFLSVEDVSFSCFFVKRGYLNNASMHRVIVPIEGETLRNVQNAVEQVEDLSFVKDMRLLAHMLEFKNYFRDLMNKEALTDREREVKQKVEKKAIGKNTTVVGLEINEFFMDTMYSMVDKEVKEETLPEEYFVELRASKKEWYDCYLNVIEVCAEDGVNQEMVEKIKKQKIFQFISRGWSFMHSNMNEVVLPYLQTKKIKEDYLQKCKTDIFLKNKNQRIIKYILANGRYPMREKQLEQCFNDFIREIFEVAEMIENIKVCEILKSFC